MSNWPRLRSWCRSLWRRSRHLRNFLIALFTIVMAIVKLIELVGKLYAYSPTT